MIKIFTNIEEVTARITAKAATFNKGSVNNETLLRVVATTILADIKTRIHEKGLASDNSAIGQYSTKPMYVSVAANAGRSFGRPIGKTGKSKFKTTGEDHKSRYFEGGYNEYKSKIGRNELGSVNLSLSGQLNAQFTVQPTANGVGLGWPDAEKFKRALALEKKYGKQIWKLTADEKGKAISTAQSILARAIS